MAMKVEDMQGAAKFLQSVTIFRTMVKIHDKKLILVHQTCMVLAFIYALFYIILGHAYMRTEMPDLHMAAVATGYNTTDMQNALALARELEAAPLYCNTTSAVHWDYAPELVWQFPQCAAHFTPAEFVDAEPDGVWVYTNWVQRMKTRACLFPAFMTNVTLMNPFTDTQLLNVGFNCTIATANYMNVYIFEPETVQLTLTPTYTSSWSAGARFDSLTLMSPAGVALGSAYIFEDTMTLSVSDLLDAAGVDLDAENKNSGGRGLEDGTDELNTNSAFNWPTYRTTGVALRAKVRVTNFRAKQPLNFNVTGEIYVEIASDGAWTSAPVDVDYFGDADVTFDAVWLERRYQGIRIEFVSEGVIGHPDAMTAFNALLSAFVVVLVAIALTDFAAQYLSDEFAAEKYEDDGERAQLDTLLEKEADHGVPFNFEDLRLRQANGELSDECYESAIFRLEKEIEELRQGGARVRSAAVLIAEDIGLPGLLDDSGPPPEPIYKLAGLMGDVILLYPGDNVVGRGLGDIKTATVSRKQLCITIDPDSHRAFIRSMRAEKAPSLPAIMRSSSNQTNWRVLTQKGQSLSLGDTIAMQIKPAAPGAEPGRLNEYRFVSLEAAVERVELSFMEKLRAQYKIPFL